MRTLIIGDPQTSLARVLAVLRAAKALTGADRLRDDVQLISVGDHFDFKPAAGQGLAEVSRAGVDVLEWMASHPPEQLHILMGNHDAARVMELHRIDDATFTQARTLAESGVDVSVFQERFPDIPTPEIAARDFSSFTEEQRALVQRLLLRGRMQLAVAGETLTGQAILVTHAGVTRRELSLLGMPEERQPAIIAAALNALLRERLDAVRAAWSAGAAAPLDLSPLHIAGTSGQEGGGLLYHRPQELPLDAWGHASARRYSLKSLPDGLLQAVGHTHHHKMTELIPSLLPPNTPRSTGRVRTLYQGDTAGYEIGTVSPSGAAVLWMIDARLSHTPPELAELLVLSGLLPLRG